MTTFATVLQTIITHYRLRIVDLTPYTGITASYISNLKRGGRHRPSLEALTGLVRGLRHFRVAEDDLQRLVEAAGYHWTVLQQGLQSLEEEAQHESPSLLETLIHSFGAGEVITTPPPSPPRRRPRSGFRLQERNQQLLLEEAISLLQIAQGYSGKRSPSPKKIYLTGWSPPPPRFRNQAFIKAEERFIATLRSLLWPHTPWQVVQLRAGPVEQAVTTIIDALRRYFGTTNYALYACSSSAPPCPSSSSRMWGL